MVSQTTPHLSHCRGDGDGVGCPVMMAFGVPIDEFIRLFCIGLDEVTMLGLLIELCAAAAAEIAAAVARAEPFWC